MPEMMPEQSMMQPQGGMAPSAAPEAPTTAPDAQTGQEASPEEQQAFEALVEASLSIMYQPKFWNHLKRAAGASDPVVAIGDIIGNVVDRAAMMLTQQTGQTFSRDVVVYAIGQDIISQLLSDLKEAGAPELDDKQIEGIIYRAVDLVRSGMQQRGEVDQTAAEQDWQQLQQQDQSGQLAQMVQPNVKPSNRQQRRARAAMRRKGGK